MTQIAPEDAHDGELDSKHLQELEESWPGRPGFDLGDVMVYGPWVLVIVQAAFIVLLLWK